MISALQRAKLLKKLKELFDSKVDLKGVAKAKVLKEILETRALLGFSNENKPQQNPNAVYQAVLDGEKELSVETLQEMLGEANADPEHYQLVPATQKLLDEFNSKDNAGSEPSENTMLNKILDAGGKIWEKDDLKRIYINMDIVNKLDLGINFNDQKHKLYFDLATNKFAGSSTTFVKALNAKL